MKKSSPLNLPILLMYGNGPPEFYSMLWYSVGICVEKETETAVSWLDTYIMQPLKAYDSVPTSNYTRTGSSAHIPKYTLAHTRLLTRLQPLQRGKDQR